ncbi:hypothetical protein I4F81_004461 [Pyropia yezoensis]|uniref:Uncharacterized protein n=1 Tax=Pyropia yezoensis TaxID=2788 RepID=A0ACC3BWH5_PYRYE|nr:hypothetical protein I4F81_004461 [Neopyropia yezoensis]
MVPLGSPAAMARGSARSAMGFAAAPLVNSDPKPVQDYFKYLQNELPPATKDMPSTIIGNGRIGNLLAKYGEGRDTIIGRGDSIPTEGDGPIYVCTRAEDLEAIIAACPESRRDDLVFLQNGMLEPILRKYSLVENTRANLYLAVPKMGATPIDGITASHPDGLTSANGKWAGALQGRLAEANLSCRILHERDFQRSTLEKLIWISAYNLVGAIYGGVSMGEVASRYSTDVDAMVTELGTMVRFTLTVGMLPRLEERQREYALTVKDFPTSLKEFEFRNGYFYKYSMLAREKGFPDPTPMHTDFLEEGKKLGRIDW